MRLPVAPARRRVASRARPQYVRHVSARGRRPMTDQRESRSTVSLIFVVDDDPDVRELVEYKLLQEGHQVLSAVNGQDALRLVPAARPGLDLLLLDVMMPGLSGFDVLARLREDAVDQVVAHHHAHGEGAGHRLRARLTLGANDYVLKPFSPRELMSRVERPAGARLEHAVACPRWPGGGLWGQVTNMVDGRPEGRVRHAGRRGRRRRSARSGCVVVERSRAGRAARPHRGGARALPRSATPAGGDEFTGHNTRRTGSLLARSPSFRRARRAPARARRARPRARRSRDELPAAPHAGDRDRPGRARAARAPRPMGVRLLPVPGRLRGRVPHDVGDERLHRGERRDPRDPREQQLGRQAAARPRTRPFPAEMPKGSVLLYLGSLYHGGGANRSARAAPRHQRRLHAFVVAPGGEPVPRVPARGRARAARGSGAARRLPSAARTRSATTAISATRSTRCTASTPTTVRASCPTPADAVRVRAADVTEPQGFAAWRGCVPDSHPWQDDAESSDMIRRRRLGAADDRQ